MKHLYKVFIILIIILSLFMIFKKKLDKSIEHFENSTESSTNNSVQSNQSTNNSVQSDQSTNNSVQSDQSTNNIPVNADIIRLQEETENINNLADTINTEITEEEVLNNIDILNTSGYLDTVNDMLSRKLDVVDSKLQDKLAQFETNNISFRTIPDDNGKDGGFNICNKSSSGNTLCTFLPHSDGNSYIRPGQIDGNVNIDNTKNVIISSSEKNILSSKNNTLITNINNGTNALCANTNGSMCSYLPYSDNNTYIRPAKKKGWVYLGHSGNDIGGISAKSKQNQFMSSQSGYASHFPNSDGNTYIRPGKNDANIFIGYQSRTGQSRNSEATKQVNIKSRTTNICSSIQNGLCSTFSDNKGNTIIRPGNTNGTIHLTDANKINMSANTYNFIEKGNGAVVSFSQNDLNLLKTLLTASTNNLQYIEKFNKIDIDKLNNVLNLNNAINNLIELSEKKNDLIYSINDSKNALQISNTINTDFSKYKNMLEKIYNSKFNTNINLINWDKVQTSHKI